MNHWKKIFLIADKKNDWRYKSGNQQPYVEEGQTIQWPKEKAQNNDMPVTGQKTKYLWPELISFGQI